MAYDREISPPPLRDPRRRGDSYRPGEQPMRRRFIDVYRPREGDKFIRSDSAPSISSNSMSPILNLSAMAEAGTFDYSIVPKGPKPKLLVDGLGDIDMTESLPTADDMRSSYICLTLHDPSTKRDLIWKRNHLQHFHKIAQAKNFSGKIPPIRKYAMNGTRCYLFFTESTNISMVRLDLQQEFVTIKLFGEYNVNVVEISEGAVFGASNSREGTSDIQSGMSSRSSASGLPSNKEGAMEEEGDHHRDIYTPPTAPEEDTDNDNNNQIIPPNGLHLKDTNNQQLYSSTPPYSPAALTEHIGLEYIPTGHQAADSSASNVHDVVVSLRSERSSLSRGTSHLSSQVAPSEMSSSRFSNENQCSKCKGAVTGINPLLSCTNCGRKYHDSCKNLMNLPVIDGRSWECLHCVKKKHQRGRDQGDTIIIKKTVKADAISFTPKSQNTPFSQPSTGSPFDKRLSTTSTVRPGPNAFVAGTVTLNPSPHLQKAQRTRVMRPFKLRAFDLNCTGDDEGTDASMDISDDSASLASFVKHSESTHQAFPETERGIPEPGILTSFKQKAGSLDRVESNVSQSMEHQNLRSTSPLMSGVARSLSSGGRFTTQESFVKPRPVNDDRPLRERLASMEADFKAEGYKIELATSHVAKGVEAYSFIASASEWLRPWTFVEPHWNPKFWDIELLVALSNLVACYRGPDEKLESTKMLSALRNAIRTRTADPRRQKLSVADIQIAIEYNRTKMLQAAEIPSTDLESESGTAMETLSSTQTPVETQPISRLQSQLQPQPHKEIQLSSSLHMEVEEGQNVRHHVQLHNEISTADVHSATLLSPIPLTSIKGQAKRQKCSGCDKMVFGTVPTCSTCLEGERHEIIAVRSPTAASLSPTAPPSLNWMLNPPPSRSIIRTVKRTDKGRIKEKNLTLDGLVSENDLATPQTLYQRNHEVERPKKTLSEDEVVPHGNLNDLRVCEAVQSRTASITRSTSPTQSSGLSNPPSKVATPTPEMEGRSTELFPLDAPLDNDPVHGFLAPLGAPVTEGQEAGSTEKESLSPRIKRRRDPSTAQINLKMVISLALSREPKKKTAREILSWIWENYPNAQTDRTEQQWANTLSGTCSLGSTIANPWLHRFDNQVSGTPTDGPKKRNKGVGTVAKWKYSLISSDGVAKYEEEYQEALRAAEGIAEVLPYSGPTSPEVHVKDHYDVAPGNSEPERPSPLPLIPTQANMDNMTADLVAELPPVSLNDAAVLPDSCALEGLWTKWKTEGRRPPVRMPEDKDDYWGEEQTDSEEEELLKFLNTDPELSKPDESCKDLYAAHPELRPVLDAPPKLCINFRKRSKRTLPDSTFNIISKPRVEAAVVNHRNDSDDEDEEYRLFAVPKSRSIEDALEMPTNAVMSLDDSGKHLIFKDFNPKSRKIFRVGTPPRR